MTRSAADAAHGPAATAGLLASARASYLPMMTSVLALRARLLGFAVAMAACGGAARRSVAPVAPATATTATAATAGDSDDRQWLAVRARYGRMRAVAGAGATDRRTDEWRADFEGGPAIAAELSRPHMAMADGAGNVYIADKEAHAIRKVDGAGRITTVAGTGRPGPVDDTPGPATARALGDPNGLFVRADGTLYVLDLDHGRIRKVATDGTMTTLVTVPGGIAVGRGLWIDGADGDERVLIASGRVIKRWTAAGGVTDWATGFVSLGNLARDGAGRLLVADRGGNRVYAIADGGADLDRAPAAVAIAGDGSAGPGQDGGAALATALAGVRAVWPAHPADGAGFFAGTHQGCQLWFIDAAGRAHLFLDGERGAHGGVGEPSSTPGKKLSELRSVTLDAAGNLLIVDDDRGFVRVVERR